MVLVDDPSQPSSASDDAVDRHNHLRVMVGWQLPAPLVRPVIIEVGRTR